MGIWSEITVHTGTATKHKYSTCTNVWKRWTQSRPYVPMDSGRYALWRLVDLMECTWTNTSQYFMGRSVDTDSVLFSPWLMAQRCSAIQLFCVNLRLSSSQPEWNRASDSPSSARQLIAATKQCIFYFIFFHSLRCALTASIATSTIVQ